MVSAPIGGATGANGWTPVIAEPGSGAGGYSGCCDGLTVAGCCMGGALTTSRLELSEAKVAAPSTSATAAPAASPAPSRRLFWLATTGKALWLATTSA